MNLVTFHTTTAAIQLETLAKELDSSAKLVPVPTKLSSSCGYAMTTDLSLEQIESLVIENLIDAESFYEITGSDDFKIIKDF